MFSTVLFPDPRAPKTKTLFEFVAFVLYIFKKVLLVFINSFNYVLLPHYYILLRV